MTISYLNNTSPGSQCHGYVAVKKSFVGEARNGTKFIDLQVTDGEVTIPAKMWDFQDGKPVPRVDNVILIKGAMSEYRGEKQLIINDWRYAQSGECEPKQFLPACPTNKEHLIEDLKCYIEDVSDPHYKILLKEIIRDETHEKFINAPGAKGIHHAYLGGLLEHSIGVCDLAVSMESDGLNSDLLVTGCLLHDVGKIVEYDWSGCVIKRTDIGKLMGHIVLGIDIITTTAALIGMDKDKLMALCHLIASHHGRLEWGSPVEPMTTEAIILHHADMLDFQMNVIDKAKTDIRQTSPSPDSKWTGKVAGIGREFWVGGNAE